MPEDSIKYATLMNSDVLLPQYPLYNPQMSAQELSLPEKNFLTSHHVPVRKRPVAPGVGFSDDRFAFLLPIVAHEESIGSKKIKTENAPTPPSCSAIASHSDENDMACQEEETDEKDKDNSSSAVKNEELSIAQVLTSLHGNTFFTVPNI